MNRIGYHHVALGARNLQETIAFYEALGCRVVRTWGPEDKPCAMLDLGGNNILEMFQRGPRETEKAPRFEHIALASTNPDEDFAAAIKAGAKPHIEPKDVNLGGNYPARIAFVIGINDEVIEFFQEL